MCYRSELKYNMIPIFVETWLLPFKDSVLISSCDNRKSILHCDPKIYTKVIQMKPIKTLLLNMTDCI
jgi:hypothetical protein